MSVNSILASLIDSPASEKDAKALEFIEGITKNADSVQKNVLTEILTQNAETEYLKRFNLEGATDQETFKSKIPMITYEDFKPLIQRIANGDRSSILSAKPVTELIVSSGTSAGKPKLIPFIEGDWERRMLGVSLLRPVINQYVKGLDKGKALHFRFIREESRTRGGLVAHPVSTSFYRSLRMKYPDYDPITRLDAAITCRDFFQSMYTQMLWGLYERQQIVRVGAPFASTLVRALTFLQLNWQQLTHDIRTGSLNPKVTDKSIREWMTRVMRPDPELAHIVALECAGDNWEGIITRIWPHTKYLEALVTGSMAQYISILDHYGGGLPIVCTRYASSECFIGINLNPVCEPSRVSYTIMPNMAYFEFLPREPHSPTGTAHPPLVDLGDVEIGKEYELVVSTYAGLYRYRVGDILRVTGFHNSSPQFQFVRRNNFLLSIDVEKTDEADLQVSVENASELLREFNTSVIEYTSYADTTTTPGHYVIYWELLVRDSADPPGDRVLERCCLAMEESLNVVYRRLRAVESSIGPLEIRVVKNGTFEEMMNHAVSEGASISQYKVPRSITTEPMLSLLDSRVISKHFSPANLHWSPEQRL